MGSASSQPDPERPLRFGSPWRLGRDDPGYQADRLQALCRFSLRVLDATRRRLAHQERAGREVWQAKQWLQQQSATRDGQLQEMSRALEDLTKGKEWLEEQYGNWRRTAEERSDSIKDLKAWIEQRERVIAEFKARIEEIEKEKQWVETQYGNWKRIAEEREVKIQALEARIQDLEARPQARQGS